MFHRIIYKSSAGNKIFFLFFFLLQAHFILLDVATQSGVVFWNWQSDVGDNLSQ